MAPLLEALKAEGVFVREVDTLGIAYHSPALEAFGAELRAGAHPGLRSRCRGMRCRRYGVNGGKALPARHTQHRHAWLPQAGRHAPHWEL